jgi:hypothetical protein
MRADGASKTVVRVDAGIGDAMGCATGLAARCGVRGVWVLACSDGRERRETS